MLESFLDNYLANSYNRRLTPPLIVSWTDLHSCQWEVGSGQSWSMDSQSVFPCNWAPVPGGKKTACWDAVLTFPLWTADSVHSKHCVNTLHRSHCCPLHHLWQEWWKHMPSTATHTQLTEDWMHTCVIYHANSQCSAIHTHTLTPKHLTQCSVTLVTLLLL